MTHTCNVVDADGHIFERGSAEPLHDSGLPRSNSRGGIGERRTLDFSFQCSSNTRL